MGNYRFSESEALEMQSRLKDARAGKSPQTRQNKPQTQGNGIVVPAGIAKATVSAPNLNKLEASYAQHLDLLLHAKQILWWKSHPFNLRLSGMKCYFAIDFAVVNKDCQIELIETKGFMRDDALVKFKVASEQYPHFIFKMVTKEKGEFVERVALAGRWVKES